MQTAKLLALPEELCGAISAAEAAVSEHTRLKALGVKLEADHRSGVEARAELADRLAQLEVDLAVRHAELEVELALTGSEAAPLTDQVASLTRDVSRLRDEIREMDVGFERFERQKQGIAIKLREIDVAVEAVSNPLRIATEQFRRAKLEAFEAELVDAVRVLGQVLMKGYALNAAFAGSLSRCLGDVNIPAATIGRPSLLAGERLSIGGEMTRLDQLWRGDAEALALYETLQPVKQVADRLAPHVTRIANAREREREAENERRRREDPRISNSRTPRATPSPIESPPPARFIPNSYTLGGVRPSGAMVQKGGQE